MPRLPWRLVVPLLVIGLALSAWLLTADPRAGRLALTTLELIAGTSALALPLGTLLAVLLVRTDVPARRGCQAALLAMLFVPLYLVAGGWLAGFGIEGWFTRIATQSADGRPQAWLYGMSGAIWVQAMALVPWVVLIVGAGLWLVEPEAEEQALLDTSPLGVLFSVTLPRALPAVLAALLWTAVTCAAEITVTDLFVVRTFAEEIFTQFAMEPEPSPVAFAPSALLVAWAIALGLAVISAWVPLVSRARTRAPVTFALGRWRWPLGAITMLLVLGIVGVPLANLAWQTGVVVERGPEGLTRTWSLVKLLRMLAETFVRWDSGGLGSGRFTVELGWSLLVGGLAATVTVLVAAPLAWSARRGGGRSTICWLATAAALAFPAPLLGLGVKRLFEHPLMLALYDALGFDIYNQSVTAPVAVQALRALPLTVLILWTALRSIPQDGLDVAECDGVGAVRRMVWLGLAARKQGVMLAWLAALCLSLGELGASFLVLPARVQLLSVQIFNALHYGQEDYVACVCLAMFLLFAVVGWGALRWLRIRA